LITPSKVCEGCKNLNFVSLRGFERENGFEVSLNREVLEEAWGRYNVEISLDGRRNLAPPDFMKWMASETGDVDVEKSNMDETHDETWNWTQTEDDVEILVEVPHGTSKKDVLVKYGGQPTSLIEVRVQQVVVFELQLFGPIDQHGCTWTLDKGKGNGGSTVVVTCEKVIPTTLTFIHPSSSLKL
jgi:hypothetical protein